MMKKIILYSVFCILYSPLFSQIQNPVKWSFSVKKESNENAILIFTAKIDKGWHLYSQKSEGEDGPMPTVFNFENSNTYELVGKTQEAASHDVFDKVFEMKVH